MKKFICIMSAVVMLLMATACGSNKYYYEGSASSVATAAPMVPTMKPEEAVDWEMYETDAKLEIGADNGFFEPAAVPEKSEQKLVYTGSISVETTEFDAAAANIDALVGEYGGYIENSSIGNRGSGYSWANYTIRVPADKFTAFLNETGELYHETYRSTNVDNITEVYYDTQGRLETQMIKLERLQELLKEAHDMSDIITIESAISETEYMIDNYSGALRHYDTMVSYATIELSLSEVYRYSNTEEVPTSFTTRFINAFKRGIKGFGSGLEDICIFLAEAWLWIVLTVVIIIAVVKLLGWQIRVHRRKKEEKKAAKLANSGEQPSSKVIEKEE